MFSRGICFLFHGLFLLKKRISVRCCSFSLRVIVKWLQILAHRFTTLGKQRKQELAMVS